MSAKVIRHTINLFNIRMLLTKVLKYFYLMKMWEAVHQKTQVIPCVRDFCLWLLHRPFDPTSVNDIEWITLSDTGTELASDNMQKCKYVLWNLSNLLSQVIWCCAVGNRHFSRTALPRNVQWTSTALRHGGRTLGQTWQLSWHAVSVFVFVIHS